MPYKIAGLFFILFFPLILTTPKKRATNLSPHLSLTVRAHHTSLTGNELNAVLSEAQGILQKTGVNLSFDVTPDSLDSTRNIVDAGRIGCDEINALLNQRTTNTLTVNIHIVDEIPCCGGAQEAVLGETIEGCSGLNMAMIVKPPDSPLFRELTAIRWVHELGHNRGLCHNGDSSHIMYVRPGASSEELDVCEQAVFNGDPPPATCVSTLDQSCKLPIQ